MPELELPEVSQSTAGSRMGDTIFGSEERAREEANAWRQRTEGVNEGVGGMEREGRKRVGPPTFIRPIPRKPIFWDIRSKIKTSSVKKLLNQRTRPRI